MNSFETTKFKELKNTKIKPYLIGVFLQRYRLHNGWFLRHFHVKIFFDEKRKNANVYRLCNKNKVGQLPARFYLGRKQSLLSKTSSSGSSISYRSSSRSVGVQSNIGKADCRGVQRSTWVFVDVLIAMLSSAISREIDTDVLCFRIHIEM